MIEIERKFLVTSTNFKQDAQKKTHLIQGYLNSDPERTVRIRIKGDKGFITIKGKSNSSGTSRYEWEKEIDSAESKELIKLCEKGIIEKIRYEIPVGNHVYEVDEFLGENQGLIIAEIELSVENETFLKPSWLGKEVTGDKRYYNSYLSGNFFKNWQKK